MAAMGHLCVIDRQGCHRSLDAMSRQEIRCQETNTMKVGARAFVLVSRCGLQPGAQRLLELQRHFLWLIAAPCVKQTCTADMASKT
jgi:hypothetical protein